MSSHLASTALFYNVWQHRCSDELAEFLQGIKKQSTSVICLTEVTDHPDGKPHHVHTSAPNKDEALREPPAQLNGLAQLNEVLSDTYTCKFDPTNIDTWRCELTCDAFDSVGFGSALFVRNDLNVSAVGALPICADQEHSRPRVLQFVIYEEHGHTYGVFHLHGLWIKGNTKGDHPLRDQQSQEVRAVILNVMNRFGIAKVVFGGDLNLDIETKALQQLEGERTGQLYLHNHIRTAGIVNTRTPLYRKYHDPQESKFADYVLATEQVDVVELTCGNTVIASDHAPLWVAFR